MKEKTKITKLNLNNNKSNNLNFFKYILIFIIIALVGVALAYLFKISSYGDELEIKDYFNFSGIYAGAVLSGIIALIVLKLTFNYQEKQFKRENNTNIINEKLSSYRDIYLLMQKLLSILHNIGLMQEEIDKNQLTQYTIEYISISNELIFLIMIEDNDVLIELKEGLEESCYIITKILYDLRKNDFNTINIENCIEQLTKEANKIDEYSREVIEISKSLNLEKHKA